MGHVFSCRAAETPTRPTGLTAAGTRRAGSRPPRLVAKLHALREEPPDSSPCSRLQTVTGLLRSHMIPCVKQGESRRLGPSEGTTATRSIPSVWRRRTAQRHSRGNVYRAPPTGTWAAVPQTQHSRDGTRRRPPPRSRSSPPAFFISKRRPSLTRAAGCYPPLLPPAHPPCLLDPHALSVGSPRDPSGLSPTLPRHRLRKLLAATF